MTWLSGWSKRIQLDIDSFYVDEDLTDFPVLITLSSGVGRNDADVRNIFSDLNEFEIDYNNWNPDDKHASFSLSNDDLTVTSTATVNKGLRSIYAVSSGKWYWETTIDVGDTHHQAGMGTENVSLSNWIAVHSEGYSYGSNGTKGNNNSYVAYGDAYVAGDVIGTALDLDNGKIWWSKNGVWQDSGVPASGTNPAYSGLSGTFYAMHSTYYSGEAATANFGDTAFTYSVPEGFNSGFYSRVYVDNTKKIMITTTDNIPCYTEIESWDWTNERAWLWTKVPVITSGTDTTLYLYYDKTQPDNDHYVGDTGDLAAKNVWNSDFEAVYHMAQDPSAGGACMLDSTSNARHGTPNGLISNSLVAGQVGKGIEFGGSGDYISIGNAYENLGAGNFTISAFSNCSSYTAGRSTLLAPPTTGHAGDTIFDLEWNGEFCRIWATSQGSNFLYTSSNPYTADEWEYTVFTRNGNDFACAVNLDEKASASNASVDLYDATIRIAHYAAGGSTSYIGTYDEIRISSTYRSDAWSKTDYYSCHDNLVTFGSEELEPLYYFDGFVYEKNTPVSRTIRLYNRSTGSLVGTDTSRSSDGYYYVTSTSSGTHFLVAFDDDAGDEYNALILDKVAPKGTVY